MNLKKSVALATATAIVGIAIPNEVDATHSDKTVFIDVGHGGHDNGSTHSVYIEDDINLQIANKVQKELEKERIKVQLSRQKDKYLSLSKRAQMSNMSGADLFLSIHQNGSDNSQANGLETLYMGNNKELANIVQQNLIESTGANNRGAKYSNLQVLRENELPAVLVECGFISNATEGYKLSTQAYQEKLADGIVEGIKEYFELQDGKSGVSNYNSIDNSSYNQSSDLNYKSALNNVNIMSDRDKNSNVIETLPAGTKVKVIDTKFDWHKIEYNGQIGYVSGVYVK